MLRIKQNIKKNNQRIMQSFIKMLDMYIRAWTETEHFKSFNGHALDSIDQGMFNINLQHFRFKIKSIVLLKDDNMHRKRSSQINNKNVYPA